MHGLDGERTEENVWVLNIDSAFCFRHCVFVVECVCVCVGVMFGCVRDLCVCVCLGACGGLLHCICVCVRDVCVCALACLCVCVCVQHRW